MERYVELCGGRYAGQVVERCQEIQGVQVRAQRAQHGRGKPGRERSLLRECTVHKTPLATEG